MSSDKKKIEVVAAAIFRENKILIAKRSLQQGFGGLWEFPGGKVEPGESDQLALQREIVEELDCTIQVANFIAKSTVEVGRKMIVMSLYEATILEGEPNNIEHQEIRWVTAPDLLFFDWAPADIPLLQPLRSFILKRSE